MRTIWGQHGSTNWTKLALALAICVCADAAFAQRYLICFVDTASGESFGAANCDYTYQVRDFASRATPIPRDRVPLVNLMRGDFLRVSGFDRLNAAFGSAGGVNLNQRPEPTAVLDGTAYTSPNFLFVRFRGLPEPTGVHFYFDGRYHPDDPKIYELDLESALRRLATERANPAARQILDHVRAARL